ncbi:glycosyltransferase family 2 protein [Planctomicrobium sp. SH661]|uniref:glycosyltransferase family 2 protein n=1 Tax=Planctomicrobium sp. SH661 TaxID=3448124 RepID=UPI003F5B9B64
MVELTGRLLEIASGRTGLDLERVRAYRSLFAQRGFVLPPLVRLKPEFGERTSVPPGILARNPEGGCLHRGAVIHQEPCSCGASRLIDVHHCALHKRCVLTRRDRSRLKDPDIRQVLTVCETCPDFISPERRAESEPLSLRSSPSALRFSHPLAKHITRFAVGITSAPRRIPTLARCVDSVIASGFSPTVYAEPDTRGLQEISSPVVQRSSRLGCFHNYLQTLRDLLAADPQAQAIVVFQDDVVIARKTREFLEHDLWPSDRIGAVSLYSPDFFSYELRKPSGFQRQRGRFLIGACAMVYPRQMAEALVTRHTHWRGCARGPEIQDETKKKAVDTWIGHALHAEQKHVYYPNPSLCQHIATTSSLGHGGNHSLRKGRHFRRSGKFAGEETTPFQLFAERMPYVRYDSEGSMRLAEPLSVIIPAWNCIDLTQKCLRALAENAGVSPLDVIYIDNGSDAGVVDQVRDLAVKLALPLRTVQFPENRGFSAAVNAGLKIATGHVLLLNNDCYIHKGCLPALLRHLLSDDRVASVGPLTADQGSQSIKRHRDLARQKGKRKSLARNMVAGFCQLKRKEAITQIGLLDENLPHGLGTDDDWCHRARAAGWKILIALDAFADHDHKSTFKRSGQDRRQLQQSAQEYLRKKGVL